MKSTMMLSATVVATLFAGLAGGCGDDDSPPPVSTADAGNDATVTPPADSGPGDAGADVNVPPSGPTAKRASKSGTIAISDDDKIVGMVNPEDGSVSFFQTSDNARLSNVKTGAGSAPSAIVIAADSKTAWVANRGAATVVRITGIDTATPTVGTPINVGSEPTGIALSPRGTKLFVAEYAEGIVSVIDTAAGTRTALAGAVRNPRAVAVTNNLDDNEADETVVVTEFFGEPVAGKEAANDGRIGHVRLFGVDGSDKGKIDFQPFTNDTATIDGATFEGKAQPNQLHSVAINGTQVFVPSISSAPALPLRFDQNLYAVMHVGDLGSKAEVTTGATASANLTQAVQKKTITGNKFFLADVVDVDFVPGLKVAYAVSRGADVVQRLDYGGAALDIGAAQAAQIDVQGNPSASDVKACHNPTGIAIGEKLQRAFVNCWGSHRMAVLDLTSQAVSVVVESTPPATTAVDRGRHFFFTGRGRWSGNGTAAAEPTANGQAWSSCGSCHPDGLSDNVTWVFAAGPRQSTSLDGSFTHGATGAGRQRIFNWTGIIDEMHDFEANTRGTSGGKGAITNAPTGQCGQLAAEVRRATLAGGLGVSNKDLADGVVGTTPAGQERCGRSDWDDINDWAKTIVPPKGKRFLDAAAVTRGGELFKGDQGGCAKCHGGGGWTISRRAFNPTAGGAATFGALPFPSAGITPAAGLAPFLSVNTTQIAAQAAPAGAAAPDDALRAPPQGSCVIRNVGTFGVRQAGGTGALDAAATLALEARGGADTRAQGFAGYNVPSLYGMTLGAPYLHHGQAATLTALFQDDRFKAHWTAGNPNFNPGEGTNRSDLVAFIESIDATTAEAAVPAGFDVCPAL